MKTVFSSFFLFCVVSAVQAQKNEEVKNYINDYKLLAISEMQRTGVPAAITLAQGIHESGAGKSKLAMASNNHFGIKCKSNWTGESVKHDDDAKGECFRKYPGTEDSYRDHSDFLKNGQRYAFLFSLEPTDYVGWANGLKKAGYATNPKYPAVLIKLIEDYQLQDYTLLALGKIIPDPEVAAVAVVQEPIKTVPDNTNKAIASKVEFASKPVVDYPSGEFKLNDTKVVYAKKGTSYLSIATDYKVSLARLFDFNEMGQAETVAADQLIFLQRKRKTGNAEYHIVQPGESLRDIAQFQAMRLEALMEYNWLKDGQQPAVGEKLSLRNKSSVMPKLALKENYTLAYPSTK